MSSKKRVGITGATGVLGSYLVSNWPDTTFVPFEGDISIFSDVQKWLSQNKDLDGILHLAALVPTAQVEADPLKAFNVNVAGSLHLLEGTRLSVEAHGSDVKRPWIFMASTSHVYSSSDSRLHENSKVAPISLYGRTKVQAEEWAEIYGTKFNLKICVGRIFSYTSAKQAPEYFLPSLRRKILAAKLHEKLVISGLHGSRDFLTLLQISDAIHHLMKTESVGVFNIGTGTAVILKDLAQSLALKLKRPDLEFETTGVGGNFLVADITKLKETGFVIRYDQDKFLKSFLS